MAFILLIALAFALVLVAGLIAIERMRLRQEQKLVWLLTQEILALRQARYR